jgi:phosphocarrier protein HPr
MDPNAEPSNGGPLRRKVRLTNPQGLHMRPARAFVELAAKYSSQVRVQRDDLEFVDGKSVLSLLLLGATPGSEITVEVDGPDAAVALAALIDLLVNLEQREDLLSPE